MQKIKLKTEESGKKLLEAYAPPKWSETADECVGQSNIEDTYRDLGELKVQSLFIEIPMKAPGGR